MKSGKGVMGKEDERGVGGEGIGTVVSIRACKLRVPGLITRYPLATFHSLILSPSGQRLPKLLPYCPQMGLTMFICI